MPHEDNFTDDNPIHAKDDSPPSVSVENQMYDPFHLLHQRHFLLFE
jgi:hypothetical protein